MEKYQKTITALVVGLIGWATQVVNSPQTHISAGEWIALVTGLAVALGVYAVKNAT